MTKPTCDTTSSEHETIETSYASANGPSQLDIVPATWNVLPRHASRDEVDVHWFFNWAEGDMAPKPLLDPWERNCLGKRIRTSDRMEIAELPGVRRAAARSSRIRTALLALDPRHVSALARWAAPPVRYPDAVRGVFGRLSAVTALTPAFDKMGGSPGLLEACDRVTRPKGKGATQNQQRHAANEQLGLVRRQAEALLAEAWSAFDAAMRAVDAEATRVAMLREQGRAPATAHLMASNDRAAAGSEALATLMAKAGR